jgi:protein-tyrosine-phosphatase
MIIHFICTGNIYRSRLAEAFLERFAAPSSQQTTSVLVQASDVLVFMEGEHYTFCKDWIDGSRQRFEIWNIQDIGPEVGASEIMTKVERTLAVMRQRADRLLTELGFS